MKFNKNETVVAIRKSDNKLFEFKCPVDGMCRKLLKRHLVMNLQWCDATDEFIFLRKGVGL